MNGRNNGAHRTEDTRMLLRYVGISLIISIMAMTVGCTSDNKPMVPERSTNSLSDSESAKNKELSYGYGQLYKTASGMKHVKTALHVKVVSRTVTALVEDISNYTEKLTGQIEQLDSDYPALRIDDPGLPELEIKRRKAVVWDQVFLMAPIQGKTGKAFERALLLSQAGVLNNLRFLTQVIKDDEKRNQRKTFLTEAHARLDDLYQRVVDLLEREYFC
jgi:hypothetical protein